MVSSAYAEQLSCPSSDNTISAGVRAADVSPIAQTWVRRTEAATIGQMSNCEMPHVHHAHVLTSYISPLSPPHTKFK